MNRRTCFLVTGVGMTTATVITSRKGMMMVVRNNNKEQLESLAKKIVALLQKHDLWESVRVYVNGKCYCSEKGVIDNISPRDYLDYCNPETISMSFEGDFYDVVNHGRSPDVLKKFIKLINEYGYAYELGNSWNLTLYKEGRGDVLYVPDEWFPKRLRVGMRVQVVACSGLDSDREGVIEEFVGKWAVIRDDQGNKFEMLKNRLIYPESERRMN